MTVRFLNIYIHGYLVPAAHYGASSFRCNLLLSPDRVFLLEGGLAFFVRLFDSFQVVVNIAPSVDSFGFYFALRLIFK